MLFSELFQLFVDILHALGSERINHHEDQRDDRNASRNPAHEQADAMNGILGLYGTLLGIEPESRQNPHHGRCTERATELLRHG